MRSRIFNNFLAMVNEKQNLMSVLENISNIQLFSHLLVEI